MRPHSRLHPALLMYRGGTSPVVALQMLHACTACGREGRLPRLAPGKSLNHTVASAWLGSMHTYFPAHMRFVQARAVQALQMQTCYISGCL